MSTILYPSPVYGPIKSRRLGLSLGINLLPADGKICNFDCLYCECGRNGERRPRLAMPTRSCVRTTLSEKLSRYREDGRFINTLTFAGNGEPTLHPDFPDILDDTLFLRDDLMPGAKVSVLTNATRLLKDDIFNALLRADTALLKLDTVDKTFIRLVDRPASTYDLNALIDRMKAFRGQVGIQTIFLTGSPSGIPVDNTTEAFVGPWLDTLDQIRPKCVAIYTIDRETPEKTLRKASPEVLDRIARRVEQLGIPVSVSY